MGKDRLGWDVTDREVAYTCPNFEIIREAVRLPNGTATTFEYLDEPPGVVIIPFTPNGELVLVREWRQAVDRVNTGLPAGGSEPGDDSLAVTAQRELREETGYTAGSFEELLTVEPANGVTNIRYTYFVARDCTPDAAQSLEEDETIEVTTKPYETVLEEALAGDLRDGRSLLGLLYHYTTQHG